LLALSAAIGTVITALDVSSPATSAFSNARTELMKAFKFGFSSSLPNYANETDDNAKQGLLSNLLSTQTQIVASYNKADTKFGSLNIPASASMDVKESLVRSYQEVAKLLFGEPFKIIPRFKFYNPLEMAAVYSGSNGLVPSSQPLAVQEVLSSVSLVRPKVADWDFTRIIKDALVLGNHSLFPLQMPQEENDIWYALPHPSNGLMEQSKASFIVYSEVAASAVETSGYQAGLMVDEWTENIPDTTVTTGITYNKNEPNAKAPNCVLIAVTPEQTGSWSLEHLISTVDETFKAAKRRAVGPKLLQGTALTDMSYPLVMVNKSDTEVSNIFK
jgi:hypothetical protein